MCMGLCTSIPVLAIIYCLYVIIDHLGCAILSAQVINCFSNCWKLPLCTTVTIPASLSLSLTPFALSSLSFLPTPPPRGVPYIYSYGVDVSYVIIVHLGCAILSAQVVKSKLLMVIALATNVPIQRVYKPTTGHQSIYTEKQECNRQHSFWIQQCVVIRLRYRNNMTFRVEILHLPVWFSLIPTLPSLPHNNTTYDFLIFLGWVRRQTWNYCAEGGNEASLDIAEECISNCPIVYLLDPETM